MPARRLQPPSSIKWSELIAAYILGAMFALVILILYRGISL